jgi:signal transduction histidine kinase
VTAEDLEAAGRPDHARLLSLAAHELRTPVSVVGGYLRMLQRDAAASLSPAQRKAIDEAVASCTRLSALVDEMSEVARLDAAAPAQGREDLVDLSALLRAAAEQAGAEMRDGPAIGVEIPDAPVPIRCEAALLQRALAAILRAIARERPDSGRVVAKGSIEGESGAALLVIGTAEEVADALGAAPEPVDLWRGGLGLGLQIAQRVIARHGGEMRAARSPGARSGRGAVVVTLPRG